MNVNSCLPSSCYCHCWHPFVIPHPASRKCRQLLDRLQSRAAVARPAALLPGHSAALPPQRAPPSPARTAQQGYHHPRNRVRTEIHLHMCCLSSLLRPSLCWDSKHGPSHTLFSGRRVSLPFFHGAVYQQLVSLLARNRVECVQYTTAGDPEGLWLELGLGLGFGLVFRACSISNSSLSCSFYRGSAG